MINLDNLEIIKIKLNVIDDDPMPSQIVGILHDIVAILEDKPLIGFKNEKEK